MNKSLALIPVVFAIFALMISPALMSAYAGTDNNGRTNGEKNANGCTQGNGKASDAGHNPNCGDGGSTDPVQFTACDGIINENGDYGSFDGVIDANEIHDWIHFNGKNILESQVTEQIAIIEDDSHKNDVNGVIDVDSELSSLNTWLTSTIHVSPCE